jgi:hypothetical protein
LNPRPVIFGCMLLPLSHQGITCSLAECFLKLFQDKLLQEPQIHFLKHQGNNCGCLPSQAGNFSMYSFHWHVQENLFKNPIRKGHKKLSNIIPSTLHSNKCIHFHMQLLFSHNLCHFTTTVIIINMRKRVDVSYIHKAVSAY